MHPAADYESPNPVLKAERLRVRFINTFNTVLHNVSFEAHAGEIICLIGPNGAGKTTLLNLLAGCLFKTNNRIKICGFDRWKDNHHIRTLSTFVPADSSYAMGKTPLEHLQAIGLLYGMPSDEFSRRSAELINDLSFAPHLHTPWSALSLGLAHKAMLIGGFLPPARLRILDEPVASGIDVLGMEILGVWMKEARQRGELILFSTQVLDRADLLADKLLVLASGHVRYFGPPAELISRAGVDPQAPYALNTAFRVLFGDKA